MRIASDQRGPFYTSNAQGPPSLEFRPPSAPAERRSTGSPLHYRRFYISFIYTTLSHRPSSALSDSRRLVSHEYNNNIGLISSEDDYFPKRNRSKTIFPPSLRSQNARPSDHYNSTTVTHAFMYTGTVEILISFVYEMYTAHIRRTSYACGRGSTFPHPPPQKKKKF